MNSTADPGNGVCDNAECTMREAIDAANANPGADVIVFDIPGPVPHTIQVVSTGLPFITDPVLIDGTTQPGFVGCPVIELDGTNVGSFASGLFLLAGDSTVRGLVINRFHTGIRISVAGGNTIEGNYIGTDVSGMSALGNNFDGIRVRSADNIIGGTTPQARNVVSGNASDGIELFGSEATGNLVQGNLIGTDVSGTSGLGNGTFGVRIGDTTQPQFGFPSNNTIGGADSGGNVISGNGFAGVGIYGSEATGNLVQGNLIGTDVTGSVALGNNFGFVASAAGSNLVGGLTAGARNVISGNASAGVYLDTGSTGILIQGNFIGTDIAGSTPLGNGQGVFLNFAVGTTIGGTGPGAGNVISGNQGRGISTSGATAATLIQGNLIGTDVTGTLPVGNGSDGLVIADTTVGGSEKNAGNVIAFNSGSGIRASGQNTVRGNSIHSNGADGVRVLNGTGCAILSNSISGNAGLGIELGNQNGVTRNDPGDGDSGPNNYQNFPELTAASSGSITIEGMLSSTPNATFTLEFFSNAVCDASGHGEGDVFLGASAVITDNAGDAPFMVTFPVTVPVGGFVTATATDSSSNTSEFSACVEVAAGCPWDCDSAESTDGTVGIVDFLTLLAQWGGPGSCDFDGGGVGIVDFLALLANWGPCP